MSDAAEELEWLIDELKCDDADLGDAVRDVERIRKSDWSTQDLPAALNHLMEMIRTYRDDAKTLTKLLQKAKIS